MTVVAKEASYRIVSRAHGTFADKEFVLTGQFKTEEEARRHLTEF